MILGDITQADLYNKILHRREEAKGGLDSWRTIELQHVHPMLFQSLADLLNRCEIFKKWPDSLTNCIATFIPKSQGNSPLSLRPITMENVILSSWSSM